MKISDLNNAKVPIVKIDKSLERFRGKVLFPEKFLDDLSKGKITIE